jgi:hypothetical protein
MEKITQYGLTGTGISMFIMTFVSIYVNFAWKYFIAVCCFAIFGGICSIIYLYKINDIINALP